MDMIVVMKSTATPDDVERVVERITELGLTPHVSQGEFRVLVGALGSKDATFKQQLDGALNTVK